MHGRHGLGLICVSIDTVCVLCVCVCVCVLASALTDRHMHAHTHTYMHLNTHKSAVGTCGRLNDAHPGCAPMMMMMKKKKREATNVHPTDARAHTNTRRLSPHCSHAHEGWQVGSGGGHRGVIKAKSTQDEDASALFYPRRGLSNVKKQRGRSFLLLFSPLHHIPPAPFNLSIFTILSIGKAKNNAPENILPQKVSAILCR